MDNEGYSVKNSVEQTSEKFIFFFHNILFSLPECINLVNKSNVSSTTNNLEKIHASYV